MRNVRMHRGSMLVVIAAALFSVAVCGAAEPTISQEALLNKLESGTAPLILDVRTPWEYRSGHVPQAVNMPHTELANRLAELADAKDREIVTYCERGFRTRIAESILREAGFSTVRHLVGDMYAWRRNGLPIERP